MAIDIAICGYSNNSESSGDNNNSVTNNITMIRQRPRRGECEREEKERAPMILRNKILHKTHIKIILYMG